MTVTLDPAEFMKSHKAAAQLNSNTPWGSRYASELRRVFHEHAALAPRNLQQHLGPSELGVECDRQVAGKMAGLPATNHVTDPWPSIVGTACHSWAEAAFNGDNERGGTWRWVTETKVTPHPDHPGHADLYDIAEQAVVDHKFLGETTLAHVKRAEGPPRKYRVQLVLYGRGYLLAGLPVKRVVLAAYPRTKASLDGLYVWDHELTEADDQLIQEVFDQTAIRKTYAEAITRGQLQLTDIPMHTDSEECYFCPFYRPQSAKDGGSGCPGTATPVTHQPKEQHS